MAGGPGLSRVVVSRAPAGQPSPGVTEASSLDSRILLEATGVMVLLVGAWLGLLAFRARLSGWTSLAAKYRARERPEGPEFPGQRARFNGCNFRRGMTVRTSPRGLFLELTGPWRFGHPPLLIPWARISGPRPAATLFGRRRLELVVSERPACAVRLDEAATFEARQYLPVPRMPYAQPARGVRPLAGDAPAPSRPPESPRAPAAPDRSAGPPSAAPAAADQWLLTCMCGWTARAPSDVAADAAVIMHQREAPAGGEHVTARSRYQTCVAGTARAAWGRHEQESVPPARQGLEEPLAITRPRVPPAAASGPSARPVRARPGRRRE